VGSDKEHLKLSLIQEDNPKVFQSIAFQMGDHYDNIQNGVPFDVCYSVTENVFRGVVSLQLRVRDIHYSDDILDEIDQNHDSLLSDN
jgi:single-stranded-DNA-specific exonuclease